MNERIKQLVEQAEILKEQSVQAKIVKNEDGTWTSILEYPDLEKFAELIVRECILTIQMGITRDGTKTEKFKRSMTHIKDIKEHFGVEE